MAFDPLDTMALTSSSDTDLLSVQASLVVERRAVDARLAAVAGEIARRSAPDAGMAGLAQQTGDRTATRLIERTAGVGADEARRLIAIGPRVSSASDPVGVAVRSGAISVAAGAAITSELDRIIGDVPAALRRDVEVDLVAAGAVLPLAQLRREARGYRDALDEAGVPDREERLYRQRRLTLTKLESGMTRVDGLLDPESAALVQSAFDQVLSPRRGGPRFIDPALVEHAKRILDDPRTTEQLMADTFVQLVKIAVHADPGKVFGTMTPAVRIHVTEQALASGGGRAVIEGQDEAVSIATAERASCAGTQRMLFDSKGQVIDVGREARLFTAHQRRALGARDGGCLHPGCDRPPSWCEAHHIDEWAADHGRTDVARGVLLCAHHHRWLHSRAHTRIDRRDGTYGLRHLETGQFEPWPSKHPLHRAYPAEGRTG